MQFFGKLLTVAAVVSLGVVSAFAQSFDTVTTAISRALHKANSTRGTGSGPLAGPRFDLRRPLPLMELLPQLTPVERAFFDKLDQELDKVESFYCERERDMRHRYDHHETV